ncbi:39442_t:CDS:2 [Gigaspora margarita]|uniref:39442_t:CDS:1 n=1 Tax=Gigaspora margarita TaxID=4874 RepID=A0ABN7UL88_GIGMA|nr:39442_t:CDS:2 [Gigaspora margarita]
MTNPLSFLVIILPKKNRKKQLYIDYQKLNSIIEKDIYLLHLIEEVLEAFQSA